MTGTLTAWQALSASDFMAVGYLRQAYADLVFLRAAMSGYLDRTVALSPVSLTEGMAAVPFPALINLIETNIEALTANGYVPSNMLPTRQWLGELRDFPRMNYQDVNRWFDSFQKIYHMILGMSKILLRTNTFCTGGDRTRQVIRTVNQ
jgi:hypothetical protein